MFWHIVEAVMLRPMQWGVSDCCTAACDAFGRVHGFDPMADFRGTYRDRASAEAVIAGAGGMLALAARIAAQRGFAEITVAVPGALGVGFTGRGDSLLFCPEPGEWVAKSRRGYAGGFTPERAWIWEPQ